MAQIRDLKIRTHISVCTFKTVSFKASSSILILIHRQHGVMS